LPIVDSQHERLPLCKVGDEPEKGVERPGQLATDELLIAAGQAEDPGRWRGGAGEKRVTVARSGPSQPRFEQLAVRGRVLHHRAERLQLRFALDERASTVQCGARCFHGVLQGSLTAARASALREATRLGHRSVGPAHIVLALLDEHRPSIAQEVLQGCGIDRERIEASAHRQFRHVDDAVPPGWATTGPLWHETAGRAQGLAATLGQEAGESELVLLALLWQPHDRWFADLLSSAQTSREVIVAALAARGVPVPRVPMPGLPPPKTQVAAFPKSLANDVNWALRRTHPDLNWGIGSDPEDDELSVVLAVADVNLGTVLDDVVGKGAWHWHRRNKKVGAK
jgi:hypothetical protein